MSKTNQDNSSSVKAPIMESVTMDSRKFLSAINSSAQSQIKFFEDAVRKLGEGQGADWNLAALLNGRLIIEDANGNYLMADYARQKGGRITINNFKAVKVSEGEKSPIFESACQSLVNAIEKGDVKDMEGSLSRIAANRFRSKAIPTSGLVRTRDGVVRHIEIGDGVFTEEKIQALADRIVEELSDKVNIQEGKLIGEFSTQALKLPVSELMIRRVVAYRGREQARNAFWSPNFQTLTESLAGYVSKGDNDSLKKAVDLSVQFLREHQEFCLLNRAQVAELIGNTLVTRGIFNEAVANDTAMLFNRVNLKVNKADIIDAWRKTAKKAEHPVMLENVALLEAAEDFEHAHDQFLSTVFEDVGETTRMALLNGLKLLKDRLRKKKPAVPELDQAADALQDPTGAPAVGGPAPQGENLPLEGKEPGTLTEGIDDPEAEVDHLINRLSDNDTTDDDAVFAAMQLLASTQGGMEAMGAKNLDNFDQEPGSLDQGGAGELPDLGATPATPELPPAAPAPATGTPTTVININTGGGQPQIDQAPATPAPAPAPEGTNDDVLGSLDDLDLETSELGGEDQGLDLSSIDRKTPPLSEDEVKTLDTILEAVQEQEKEEEQEVVEEKKEDDGDLFTLPEGIESTKVDAGYGMTILAEYVLDQKISEIEKLIGDKKLPDDKIDENLDQIVGTSLAGDPNLSDPAKMEKAKKELIGAVMQKRLAAKRAQAAKANTPLMVGEDVVAENQIKSPTKQLSKRGLKKAAINKLVEEGKLEWIKKEGDGVLGEFKGVRFVIDHANPAVLLSSDGEIEIPIPESLIPGALYLAEVTEKEADADDFVEWLDKNIGQLKPITEAENKAIDEGIAKITVTPDVKVEVDVAGDNAAPVVAADPPVVTEPPIVPEPVQPKIDVPPPAKEDGPTPPKPEKAEEGGEKEEEAEEDDDEDLEEALKRVLNPIEECDSTCSKGKKKKKSSK